MHIFGKLVQFRIGIRNKNGMVLLKVSEIFGFLQVGGRSEGLGGWGVLAHPGRTGCPI